METEQKHTVFDTATRDAYYWRTLDELFKKRGYDAREILRHFPSYVMRRDLPRFLAHYELFKLVLDVPGSFADVGVFRGASFFTWANLLDIFAPGDRTRRVYGFDSFEGLQTFNEADGPMHEPSGKVPGGYQAQYDDLQLLVEIHSADSLMPGISRCELVVGDVRSTVKTFAEKHPGVAFSLLHLDLDLYEPTLDVLEALYPRVVTGGVICFDEYGMEPWEGEFRAVEEFISRLPGKPTLKAFPFASQPSAYFIKK